MPDNPPFQTIKIVHQDGTRAVRNGIKPGNDSQIAPMRKPVWLKKRLGSGDDRVKQVRQRVRKHGLNTVCEEALCPNLSECWARGTATFMLLGAVCTRACRFCAVDTGKPANGADTAEPEQVAEAVADMGLKYVVLTSVNRDDLKDGGAAHFAASVRAIRRRTPHTEVEVLVPDFAGNLAAAEQVAEAGTLVFAHNLETVRRLTPSVRDPRASYDQSLRVLKHIADSDISVMVKSGLILGLGESDSEIADTLRDLQGAGVQNLTLGQYLRPTRHHLPVQRWVTPQKFEDYRQWALEIGFELVTSGPMVRSSYRAEEAVGRTLLQQHRG